MIRISLGGTENLLVLSNKFQEAFKKFPQALKDACWKFSLATITDAKDKYILKGGQTTETNIASRSGRLRSSINAQVKDIGTTIEMLIGSNVKYAPIHEYGFSGTVSVPAHVRRQNSRNLFRKESKISKTGRTYIGRTKIAQGVATVRSFTKKMNIKARPYIKPAIMDNFPKLQDDIGKMFGGFPDGQGALV